MSKASKKHGRTIVLVFLTVWLSVSPAVIAAAGGGVLVAGRGRDALRTRITRVWADESIDKVLMDLAEDANVDIVSSPKVTGNVTARVTDVPLHEALSNILAAYDYTYVTTDNMIRVMPASVVALAQEELVSRLYRIIYADANEVAGSLRNFVSDKGSVAFNKGTSHIAVTDTEKKIKAIDKFIAEIDRETPQVLIEVKVYDITTKEGFDLEIAWHVARNDPLETISRTKTTTGSDSPSSLATTTHTEETRNDQEFVNEYKLGNYPSSSDAYGSMWQTGNIVEDRTEISDTTTVTEIPKTTYSETITRTSQRLRHKPFVGGSFDRVRGGSLSFSLLNDMVDIDLALEVLKSEVESKLLANPRILVLDNETAYFKIVREFPYRYVRQEPREDPITYTEFKDVGVQLKVTPHIARDGLIKLHIAPEFGILVSQDINGVPTVDTRRADTVAIVRDGQTIAIGGLRKHQTTKIVSKVPLLGDLPLLKGLFRSTSEIEEINELVVFITPRIITRPEMLAADMNDKAENGIPRAFNTFESVRREHAQVVEPVESEPEIAESELEIGEQNPLAMMQLGYAYLKMQRFELAKEMLTGVIELGAATSTTHQYLGYCHLKLKEVDQAVESYLRAVEMNDIDWEAHRGLGVALMFAARRNNDEDLKAKAIEEWRISLDIKPDQSNADALAKMIGNLSQ